MTVERPVKQLIKSQKLKLQHNKYNFNPKKVMAVECSL